MACQIPVNVVGEEVAFIVAETVNQAKDAAEQIIVDYSPLPAVVNTLGALEDNAPRIWEDCPGNISFTHERL